MSEINIETSGTKKFKGVSLLTKVSKNTALQTHTELPTNSTNIITENDFWINFTYLKKYLLQLFN